MKYFKTLASYLKERNPEVDQYAVDLIEGLLTYNPNHRLSAKAALEHPYFKVAPFMCIPSQIQKLNKEYHEYVMKYGNNQEKKKLYKEKLEQEKKENESNKKWAEPLMPRSTPSGNKDSKKRLENLLKLSKKEPEEEDREEGSNQKSQISKRKPERISIDRDEGAKE